MADMKKPEPPQRVRDDLFNVIAELGTAEECRAFFTDLCTPSELDALAGRWHVARRLAAGVPYRDVAKETGISIATVTRVARALHHDPCGGYRAVLARMGIVRGR